MELAEALSFLPFVFEKEQEDRIWQHWLSLGVFGQQEIGYNDLLACAKEGPKQQKTDDEILEDVAGILGAWKGGGGT